jgi:LacI family transcriptional regulator
MAMTTKKRILLMMSTEEGYARQILKGIIAYARPRTNWMLHRVRQRPQARSVIRAWKPEGIIGHFDCEPLYAAARRSGIPLVEVLRHPGDVRVPHVVVDDRAVGRLAAEHFLERGFRQFGFVGYRSLEFSEDRHAGFHDTLQACRNYCKVYLHRWSEREVNLERSWVAQEARLTDWLKRLARGTGILVADDAAALEVNEHCLRLGLRVPEDVAILGVDNDDLFCQMSQPALSSVRMPLERVGFEAARMLDRLLQGRKLPSSPLVLPPLGVAARQSTDVFSVADPLVAEALRYIDEHAAEPILVEDVLGAVAVSRSLLEKRFRACLGRTPLAEITRQRVQRARQLLAETELPIARIGPLCGFTSNARLSTIFHRHTGQTPTAYRRSYKVSP